MATTAVCFLTRIPNDELTRFADELATRSNGLDVYVVIDDNTYQVPSSDKVRFLQVDNDECMRHGFKHSSKLIAKIDCLSWDKALFFFCCREGRAYDFVWLVEDDVFIPSIEALLSLHGKCVGHGYDLVCQRNHHNLDGKFEPRTWDLWPDAAEHFSLPWYHSMVCAVGLSRQLLTHVHRYAETRGHLAYLEYLFNTLTMHEKLHVYCPEELATINYRHDWLWKEIQQRPMNWFHPIKDFDRHHRLRQRLANQSTAADDEPEPEQNEYEPDCFCLQSPNV